MKTKTLDELCDVMLYYWDIEEDDYSDYWFAPESGADLEENILYFETWMSWNNGDVGHLLNLFVRVGDFIYVGDNKINMFDELSKIRSMINDGLPPIHILEFFEL